MAWDRIQDPNGHFEVVDVKWHRKTPHVVNILRTGVPINSSQLVLSRTMRSDVRIARVPRKEHFPSFSYWCALHSSIYYAATYKAYRVNESCSSTNNKTNKFRAREISWGTNYRWLTAPLMNIQLMRLENPFASQLIKEKTSSNIWADLVIELSVASV